MFNQRSGERKVLMSDGTFSSYTVMDVMDHNIAVGNISGVLRVLHVKGKEKLYVVVHL